MQIIGIKKSKTNFNEQGAKNYDILTLYCTWEDDKAEGICCGAYSISSARSGYSHACSLCIGDNVIPYYNQFRKVEGFNLVE